MEDLSEVISSALEDATPSTDPTPETPEIETDAPIAETPEVAADAPAPEVDASAPKVEAAKPDAPKVDDFEKKYGIPSVSLTGKENRIPYSRVKKITEKAVADAKKEWEGTSAPKLTDYETKIKDYEGKLEQVKAYENMMVTNQEEFLTRLSTLPAYKPFFDRVREAFALQDAHAKGQVAPQAAQPADPGAGMPEPDQALSDGTKVYSMEGLKALLGWQASQVEARVTKQVEARYAPIETQWQADQRVQAMIPQVRAQIDEARTWPLFNENEEEVVKALQAEPRLSLEGAYRKVVFPKITADRNKMREDILKEVKQAPRSTSAPASVTKAAPASDGPKSITQIIAEQIKTLK